MDHSAGASSEHLEARSELLLVTSLELADAQGTVGKLSISAFRRRRQREPSEASLAISTAMDHVGKIVFHGKIAKLPDTTTTVTQGGLVGLAPARYSCASSEAPRARGTPRALIW